MSVYMCIYTQKSPKDYIPNTLECGMRLRILSLLKCLKNILSLYPAYTSFLLKKNQKNIHKSKKKQNPKHLGNILVRLKGD